MRTYSFLVLFIAVSISSHAQSGAGGPCALLTKAEVREASGLSVSDGVIHTSNKSVCDFTAGEAGSIGMMLTAKGPGQSAENVVAEFEKRKMTAEVVPNIGDGAYYFAPGYGMQQIGAFKGSKQVIVTVRLSSGPEAKARAVAEKVARKAVGKM